MHINLTNIPVKIAINPDYTDDVMFCEGYEEGVAVCDFGPDLRGKHAVGIRIGPKRIDRQCALITHSMLEIIDWDDSYSKIVEIR